MRSGSRLRRWAGYLCSQRTMEQLIDPVIADLQHECAEADASGHTSNKYVALLRGYVAFWILLTLHVPQVWLIGRIQAFTAGDRPTLRPSLLAAALTTALVTASLVATPARQITRHGVDGAWTACAASKTVTGFRSRFRSIARCGRGWRRNASPWQSRRRRAAPAASG